MLIHAEKKASVPASSPCRHFPDFLVCAVDLADSAAHAEANVNEEIPNVISGKGLAHFASSIAKAQRTLTRDPFIYNDSRDFATAI